MVQCTQGAGEQRALEGEAREGRAAETQGRKGTMSGDIDGDGTTDGLDLASLLSMWGREVEE